MYNCRVFYLSDALLMMSTFCKIFERLFFGEIFFMICSNLKELKNDLKFLKSLPRSLVRHHH